MENHEFGFRHVEVEVTLRHLREDVEGPEINRSRSQRILGWLTYFFVCV